MKEYQKRALRTFSQAFFGYTLNTNRVYQGQEITKTIWISILASALAGGISGIMNLNE